MAGLVISSSVFSQQNKDSAEKNWSIHYQTTIIAQQHSAFHSLYAGANSLTDTVEPAATSITATLFIGRKLWHGAAVYFNPEMSGGNGLSYTRGVAGALNGETYRVGATSPKVFVARAYLQQTIPLTNTNKVWVNDEANQLQQPISASRITISAGKFSLSDFYDDNSYSKDPRTQFLNWSLWANGAWDYPANTRGYTYGLIAELIKPKWSLRFSSVAEPRVANAPQMEYHFNGAHGETIEYKHHLFGLKLPGSIGFIIFYNHSKSLSYADGLLAVKNNNAYVLNVIKGYAESKEYGGEKMGVAINFEKAVTNDIRIFSRAGWNDGKYASWAFTEIDRTFNMGLSVKGTKWKRDNDVLGIASVWNGISSPHRKFLEAGGYGFIIGDGRMNYGTENIVEVYYSAAFSKLFFLSFDYQLVNHPGYNKDRGPVNVGAIRFHIEL
ncbi:MAG: carbohydrate porin [Sphingobacteriales bacterium]|nr:carbohydrate porin [Sphingobacteriales bacterium]